MSFEFHLTLLLLYYVLSGVQKKTPAGKNEGGKKANPETLYCKVIKEHQSTLQMDLLMQDSLLNMAIPSCN